MSSDPNPSASKLASVIYRALVLTAPLRGRRQVGRVWQKSWDLACRRWSGPVTFRLHGRRTLVNFGYPYPVYLRQCRAYNMPLVDAVNHVADVTGQPVVVVDVGAAVGDTALLLKERCPRLRGIVCIDADPEFLRYLRANLGDDPDVEIIDALLGREKGSAGALVRTHRGSASATGPQMLDSVTLDSIVRTSQLAQEGVHVLKVDVDGYDGAVLAGARVLLKEQSPTVLFEWHPPLYIRAGNDVVEPFRILTEAGYRTFRWYRRTGDHDFDEVGYDSASLQARAQACLTAGDGDEHWDVLARRCN